MKPHKCEIGHYCMCSIVALEPDNSCPIHGFGWYDTPRCIHCGRFMKKEKKQHDEI